MTHRCPASIPKGRWRDLWNDCLDQIVEPSRAQARMLERMVLNLMAADAALATALKEPTVPGSKGQPVENPMFQVAARCDTQARNTAKELRLLRTDARKQNPDEDEDPFASFVGDELAEARRKREAS